MLIRSSERCQRKHLKLSEQQPTLITFSLVPPTLCKSEFVGRALLKAVYNCCWCRRSSKNATCYVFLFGAACCKGSVRNFRWRVLTTRSVIRDRLFCLSSILRVPAPPKRSVVVYSSLRYYVKHNSV